MSDFKFWQDVCLLSFTFRVKEDLSHWGQWLCPWCSECLRRQRSALKEWETNFTKLFFSLLLPNLSLRWHPPLFLEFPHQCPSLYLAPHSGRKAGHGHRLSHPVPGSFHSSKPTVDHNCYSVCVHSRPWRRFLHFSTKESTWLRCDIIASWESLPWEDLFGFSEVGCVLICICDTC